MGRFKRFCLIVFGLAGTLCLVALALPWIGPYTREAASLLNNSYYVAFVLGAFVITMIGLLITLLRGLLSPAKRKVVTIDKTGGDKITVTTAAISSQATHVVEDRGRFIAEKVQVETKRGGDVSVHVRVKPRHVVSVVDEGRHLRGGGSPRTGAGRAHREPRDSRVGVRARGKARGGAGRRLRAADRVGGRGPHQHV